MVEQKSNHRWEKILPELRKNKFLFQKNKIRKLDMHDHAFLELTYVLKGNVKHNLDGQVSILKPGDFFFVDYGSMHSYETLDGSFFENFDCLFLPELLDPTLKGASGIRNLFEHCLLQFDMHLLPQNPSRTIFHDDEGAILSILEQMQKESENRCPGYIEMMRCCLTQILILTVRKMENASLALVGKDSSSFVTTYISEHYMEPITLSDIAQMQKYSLSYLSKKFKEDMGVSFVKYLQNYRILQACRLLLSTRRTVDDIANAVGYGDVKFFVRLFKRNIRMTPNAFRHNNIERRGI